MPSATVVQKLTMTSIPFDPQTDIAPITLAGTVQTAFCVSPTLGVHSLKEYIEWLKKNPTRNNFGTTAMGSFTHFFGVMAGQAIGIPLEPVPYRGAAPLVADLQVTRSGRLRRHHRLPRTSSRRQGEGDLHLGPDAHDRGAGDPDRHPARLSDISILGWYIFFAPPKTPPALNRGLGHRAACRAQAARDREKDDRVQPRRRTSTPAESSQRMAADFKRWKEILDFIGYKPAN